MLGRVNWSLLLGIALLLLAIAVGAGLYLGKRLSAYKPQDMTAPIDAGRSNVQNGQFVGEAASMASAPKRGGVAPTAANEPGAIVAPGGVELQVHEEPYRAPDPAEAAASAALPSSAAQ